MTPNAPRWYQNGVFGQLGYATPYINEDDKSKWYSNNQAILTLLNTFGKIAFGIFQQPDIWKSTPPQTNNFCQLVGKGIDRFRAILSGKYIPPGQQDLRTQTLGLDPQPFLVFPIPYFRVRNPWAKQWAGYILQMMAEGYKHPNNLDSLQINQDFASNVSKYTDLIYRELALELLGKKPADVNTPGFVLTDADYAAYNPDAMFTSIEKVDTGAPLNFMLSPEDVAPIIEGIPIPVVVPFLKTWPITYQPPKDVSNIAAGSQTTVPTSTMTAQDDAKEDSATAGATATASGGALGTGSIPPPGP